jgi:CubicO group peptidase (beta-lactamase class C family)
VDSEITGTHWQGQSGNAGANEASLSESHAFKTGWLGEMFTAALALRLVETGALSLDALVSDYLGADATSGLVTFRGEDLTDQLTIRHLLSHRSGLGDLFQGPATQVTPMLQRLISEPGKVVPNGEFIDYVRHNLAANSRPGTDFLHSEVNYILLAEAIESQTGKSLAAAFRQHISEPLGMDQTWHLLQEQAPGGISLAAMQLGDTDLRQIPSLIAFDAGNAWATTTRDLGKFIHGLFDQEIFAESATLDAMFEVHSSMLGAAQYGMGAMIRGADCAVSEAQLRGYIGTGAFAVMIPERKTAVYGFTTRLDYFGLGFLSDALEALYSSSRCRDVGNWAEVESPGPAGFSSAGLEALTEFLDTTDSAAFLAVSGGQVVYRHGQIGRAYASHSIRKSFLSALVGNAVDEGDITLTNRLLELSINDVNSLSAQKQSATVGDLLKSRSGIYLPAAAVDPGTQRPTRDSVTPGSRYFYNNWDFNVMGTIYEQATGDGLYDRFEQEIAIPLGMEDFRVKDQFYIFERR